jgi:PAS domain S-box-containing protein
MTTPTTLPEALTEIEGLRGQVRELLRLLGQEAPLNTGAAGLSTSEIAGLNGMPESSLAQVSLERKQTGRERTQIVAEGRNVIEIAPDIIFKLDLHGNLAGWNKRLETVTGFAPEELNGRSAVSFAPECEREQTAAAILRVFEEGYAELEGHLLTKDQRAIPYHWTGAALKSDEGQVIGITGVGRDVSEKKRIEAELRRQQQSLLAAQAMAHVGSWDWDIVSGAMEWSEEQFRIFGYEPKAIPPTHGRFLTALHPDDHDRVVTSINDTLEGKTSLDVECRIVRPDGEVRTVHYLGKMIGAEGGSPVRLSGSALDITDRKRAESALQQSEAHFRALIENSSDIITVLDLDGTIRFESPSFERLLGYAQHEIDGRIAFDFIHPADLPTVLERFQLLVQRPGETHTAEFRFRHKDGCWRQFEGVGRTARDSHHRPCVIVNSRDITERKTIERQRLEQAERLRLAMDIADLATWDWDISTNKVIWSDNYEQVKRLPPGTFDGTFEAYQRLVHPDDLPTLIADINRALAGPDSYRTEHRIVPSGGEIQWIEGNGAVYRDEMGRPIRMIGTARNITERKRMEDERRKRETLISLMLQTGPGCIKRVAADGTLLEMNQAGLRMIEMEEENAVGCCVFDVIAPEHRASFIDMHQAVLTGASRTLQVEIQGTRGTRRWIETYAVPFLNPVTGCTEQLAVAHDITTRKQAEQALADSEARFRTVVEGTSDWMWEIDAQGRYTYSSPRVRDLLGYEPEEILGKTPFDFMLPEEAKRVGLLFGSIVEARSPFDRLENTQRHKDGNLVMLECRGVPILDADGALRGYRGFDRDVTIQKQAEKALRISEERYARATAVGKVGVWELDVATGSYHSDVNLKTLFGYEPDELSTDPYVWLGLVHPDDQSIALQAWERVVSGSTDEYHYELRMIRKDGTLIWTDVRGHAERDEHGHVQRLIGSTVDITERKQAISALQISQLTLQQTLQASNTGLWEWNTATNEVTFSPEWKRQLGYEEAELPNTFESWESRLHPDDRARTVAYAMQYRDHPVGTFRQDFRLLHKDGTYRWIDSQASFVTEADGRHERLLGSHTDITERKQAEAALRGSELRFRTLVEGIGDVFWISDPAQKKLVYASQAFEDIWGRELQQLYNHFETWLEAIHEDDRVRVQHEFYTKISTGQYDVEYRVVRPDGTIRWIRDHGRPLGIGNLVAGVAEDITERAQAEEALRRSEARLKEAQRIAHIGSWELDLVANRLTWSDEIYRIFEIDAEAFGASYEAFLQLVHPDDRNLVDRAYTESVTFRTPYNITHRLLMPDGRIKFVREQCETQYGRDGLALRSSGTVQDITKQKEAEEALAQNHTLLTAIMDASIDLISIKDLQGRYVHINRAGAEAVGMPAEAVIGWDDVALWGGGVAASRRASDRFVTESGQTITVEEQGTLLDDLAHYLTTKAPYRDSEGSIIGVIGIARNITKWKRVEEERQKALTLLTNVINATPDLIFVKDRDLRTILCNNSFAQAVGKTPEDVIGRSDIENGWDSELVRGNRDAGIPGYESDDRKALTGKVVHDPSDPVNVNGEVRIFDTYKVPLRDETGEVIGILGVSRDVTERKRMEEMLRQREWDLRAAVEERERISEDLHDGILQSIFAVGLGLESCRTLVSKLPRKKAATPLMAGLNRAIGQLNHVMTEVRNFIAGIESHVLEEADIGQTLRTMVQAMCASNGTACRVTIEEAAVRELSTEQAYHAMNLIREALSNSLRHSEAGRITLSFKRLRRSVRLSVTDNGKGFIPDSARDAGHGLINMAARARKLGGRIEVHSRPRQGTKVLLDIPGRPVDE